MGLAAIWARIGRQAARLRVALGEIPGVTVHDLGQIKGGIVPFTIDGAPAPEVCASLKARRINTNVSSVARTRFDMEAQGMGQMMRASVHCLRTDDEIRLLADAVARLAGSDGRR